jgi:hypothetical protein
MSGPGLPAFGVIIAASTRQPAIVRQLFCQRQRYGG